MCGLSLANAVSCCLAENFLLNCNLLYMSYVRPVVLHRSEAWCLKESEMGMLQMTERSTW